MGQRERAAISANDPTILLVGTGRLCDRLYAALETLGMDVERASAEVASAAFRAVAPDLCVIADDVSVGGDKGGIARLLEEQVSSESPTVFIAENSQASLPQKYARGGTVTLSSSLPVLELADQIINIAGELTKVHRQTNHRKASEEVSDHTIGVVPIDQYRPSSWLPPIDATAGQSMSAGRRFMIRTGRLFDRLKTVLYDLLNTYRTGMKLSRSNVIVIGAVLGFLIVGSSVLAISIRGSTDAGAKVKPIPLQKRTVAALPRFPPQPLTRTDTAPAIPPTDKQDNAVDADPEKRLSDEEAEPEETLPIADGNPKVTKDAVTRRVGANARSKRAGQRNPNAKQSEQRQQVVKAYKLIREGNRLLKDNRLGMAEAYYLKALQAKPNYPRAMASLVRVHLRRGDGNEAARWAKSLNKIQPKNSTNRRLLENALTLQNNKSSTRKVKPTR